ncbi:MAG: hypothetical protein WBQ17_09425 [Rhizomicrobium sp.]|jgi:hypothetical protein
MFENVTILLSFVFAIALTHLLTSSTELVWARDRVRFSGLQAVWMINAGLGIVVNWLAFGDLRIVQHWNIAEVLLQFVGAVIQYYTCSLLSLRPHDEGVIDMPAFYERQRPAIFTAFAGLMICSMAQNYWDRSQTAGLTPTSWIGENGVVLTMLALIAIAGLVKPRWLQWIAALGMLALTLYFLVTYAVPV